MTTNEIQSTPNLETIDTILPKKKEYPNTFIIDNGWVDSR